MTRATMSGEGMDFVGLNVGKFALPDKHQPNGINTLSTDCRVCRVFSAEESPGESCKASFGSIGRGRIGLSCSCNWT
jgi:hypothetical protein